jgi:hypothetical protein
MKIIINQRREILLLGSVRESIMTPSETSSEKKYIVSRHFFLSSSSTKTTDSVVTSGPHFLRNHKKQGSFPYF